MNSQRIRIARRAAMMISALAAAISGVELAPGAEAISEQEREFFETRIRPVLAQDCYECHNSKGKSKGGLSLDHREAMLAGGDSGKVIVPGDANASLLMAAIRHLDPDLEMPKAGAKLEDEVIADFARWIGMGAPDPRDQPPSDAEITADTSWEAVMERRKQWWSFQPPAGGPVPDVADAAWSDHPVDRFVLARLEAAGLPPAPPADPRSLIRRLSFALTGLPPTAAAVEAFVSECQKAKAVEEESARGRDGDTAAAIENIVASRVLEKWADRLLDSPAFGECWARHWMDWVRFAETHGSEGDQEIPFAWRYRDYLIRALNADITYDQLVREHLAGDLLENPRIDPETGINESILGTAHLRMVFHGFNPTDALDELVRFTDDQINVFSKGFQGLTVSCARCHNHKFDPVSQEDYYALFGIFASTRPGQVTVDAPGIGAKERSALAALKPQIKEALAGAWLEEVKEIPERLLRGDIAGGDGTPLEPWSKLSGTGDDAFAAAWAKFCSDWKRELEGRKAFRDKNFFGGWDLRREEDAGAWFRHGTGLRGSGASRAAGDFAVLPEGDGVISNIYPAGVYTHLISGKDSGVFTSPEFTVGSDAISVRILGQNFAQARLVVQNYPFNRGNIYAMKSLPVHEDMRWYTWEKTDYWIGDRAHIEVATRDDLMAFFGPKGGDGPRDNSRSGIGIAEVVFHRNMDDRPPELEPPFLALLNHPGASEGVRDRRGLAELYRDTLRGCIIAWRENRMTDDQANFLGGFVRTGGLSNSLAELAIVAPLVEEYRRLEDDLPVPHRAPGVTETVAFDQPFYERGNHKNPGHPVPRRFLEAIDATPYQTTLSGRRELAEDVLRPDNPLTARLVVNRLWHYLFGRGLCATVDNFGRMGEKPTHPELLDYLALKFVEEGWSLKKMIRFLVTSQTFAMSSEASEEAAALDPANELLSHFRVRRLDAEAIRDSLLAVSGRLDPAMFGSGTNPETQPENDRRRSVYVTIERNRLNPFLAAFDAPEPAATKGRRDATNVPAQSLTLLNDPFVSAQAKAWAESVAADVTLKSDEARVRCMFQNALGRPPSVEEAQSARAFLVELESERERQAMDAAAIKIEIEEKRRDVAALVDPVRARLANGLGDRAGGPEPAARWEFEDGFEDALGELHGSPFGNARIEDGALVLDGKDSFVRTAALPIALKAKTLEAWVRLDTLDQRGGGVVTVQDLRGGTFDAIVFGEKAPRQWMAGSDHGERTEVFGGSEEVEASEVAVHVAVTYAEDGTIAGYRNGEPYGAAYKSVGPVVFETADTEILFGLRHASPAGNRLLSGRILEARLYDRALSPEEVAASARSKGFVSGKAVLAALSPGERAEKERLEKDIAGLQAELNQLMLNSEPANATQAWKDLGHAIFNLKEFIYVR